jgi:two-component system, chemotaxis family, chemotaxis protein CheY
MQFAPDSASPTSLPAPEPDVVMIVDDDPALVDGLSELLEDEGYVVATARDGLDALAQLRAGLRPSVILLDLMMPRMDGWDFRQAQLRDDDLRDIPIVVISAAGFSVASVRAQFGDIDFVPKPPREGELLDALRRCCE